MISTTAIVLAALLQATPPSQHSPAVQHSPPERIVAPAPVQVDTTLLVLRAQLAVMREYDQRLLDTIHWSLGGIVTAALVLVTAGWFANFRIYERDKLALQRELDESVKAREAILTQTVAAALDSAQGALASGLDERFVEVRKDTADRIRGEVLGLSGKLSELKQTVMRSKFELARLDIEKWERQGVPANVARACTGAVNAALDVGVHHYELGSILDTIIALMKSGTEIDAGDAHEMSRVLARLPEDYLPAKERIQAYLSRA